MPLRLALYQPDIPQNAGALMRMSACLGVPLDIIEPCGFVFDDAKLRRAGMDYRDRAECVRHRSWQGFLDDLYARRQRLVLLTTGGEVRFDRFAFRRGDTVLVGRESAGVPPEVAQTADASLRIPMKEGVRSLNVALAAALVVGEALRQLDAFPTDAPDAHGE